MYRISNKYFYDSIIKYIFNYNRRYNFDADSLELVPITTFDAVFIFEFNCFLNELVCGKLGPGVIVSDEGNLTVEGKDVLGAVM